MFETVRKGDIEAVKRIERRIGLDVQYLIDGNTKQNANFAAMKIVNENDAINMIQWLVGKGCQIKLTDDWDQTCLYYAARDGRTNTVQCLLELDVEMNHVDTFGQTAFFYSCREGHFDTCKLLIQSGIDISHVDNDGQTPLFYSIRSGCVPLVKLLIEKGVDVNHPDIKGFTPFMLCKQIGSSKEIVDLLIKNGSKVVEYLPVIAKSSTKN